MSDAAPGIRAVAAELGGLPESDVYRALIEQIPLAIYVDRLDESSSNVYSSPQVVSLLGYSVEEWTGDEQLLLRILHPDDRDRVLAEHERSRETGEPFRMEYRMLARDGRTVWLRDEATVVYDGAGQPVFHYGFLLDITDRKELEEALRSSEDELRRQKRYSESLLEISPAAIVTMDLDGKVTSWNPAAERLFGYSPAEAIGRDLETLIAAREDLRAEARQNWKEVRASGTIRVSTRRMRKDGTLVDVDCLGVRVAVEGEATGHLVVYHDISALKEAERRYRDLVENLPLVTYVDEPTEQAASIYISPQVESLLGYAPEEWLADPELFAKILHPEDRERVLADHVRVFAAGEPGWSFEYRVVARDGRTAWLRDEAVVVSDEAGKPLYVQGFLIDITKRKLAEEALVRSEQRFRALFEAAPIGVAWGPLDGSKGRPVSGGAGSRLYTRNRAYCEMLGYSEEEIASLHFSEYTHADDLPRELELYEELVTGRRERYELEKRYIRKDGRVIWAHVVEAVVRDDQGTPLFGMTMVQDVTERRLAEEALRESEAELRRQKQYLESLVRISPVAIVTLDLEERVTSWNPAAELLFGYAEDEAVGTPLEELVLGSEGLYEEGVRITQRAFEEGSAHVITRRTRKDGSLVDVEVLMVPLTVDGETVGSYVIYHDVSALHRQKRYFESLLEISPTAIITVDTRDTVTSWNPAAERLFGYTREEAIGHNVDELVAATDELRREALDVNRRGLEDEVQLITRRTRKDGSLVDVHVLVAPVEIEGELVGRYGIYHDISELQRQKRYFQCLLENSPNAIAALDLDGRVTDWNSAAEELFGYSRDEAIGRDLDDLVAASDELRAEAARVTKQAVESGQAQFIARRTRKDGSLVDVEVLVAPVVMDGEAQAYYAIYHDLTELLRQNQFFQSLLDNSPTAIAAVDLDDKVAAWNPAAEKLFGYTREEAIGRNVEDLVTASAEMRAEAVAVSRQAKETGEAYLITRRARKDGTLVDVEVLVAPVVVGGQAQGFFVIYHDIGELLRARREAEAATQAKSAFLATMSHEIRTPMNAVIGMTGLLLDTELAPEQRQYAEIIRTSGETLLAVIDDILDFSKIEAGRLDLEERPFVLRDCVESALDVVAPGASEKGLELAYLLDAAAPVAIVGDEARLRQIVINLLSNAVKFTEAGEVVVSVDSEALAPGDGEGGRRYRLHFAVRDTGIGIPEDRMDRLFQSFSQLDASTTRKYGGTGLGLAISKRLSELMGGTMWAESEVGKGSTFHFTVVADAAAVSVPASPEAQPELRRKRILIVDDNETNRTILLRHAEAWGMSARATASPLEALEWIRRGDPFDLAVLDMQMPEMDGTTLAAEIRRHRPRDVLPLVVLTSLGGRSAVTRAGSEFDAQLAKPIKASHLYDVLVDLLARRPAPAPAEPARSALERERAGDGVRPLRILLVEDNDVNQKLALALLAKLGYRADVARNGVEALDALRREPYDVVFMDVEMPEMDGLEATRRIRVEWRGADGPHIVAMTANAMQGDREMCLAAGMDDYLSKPIRTDELAAAIARSPARAEATTIQPAGDDAVLDPGALEALEASTGDRAFVGELVDTFLADAPRLVATVADAHARGDADELRRAAHTLKSSARLFGAASLADLCEQLEAVAAAGTLENAPALVAAVEDSFTRVEAALAVVRRDL